MGRALWVILSLVFLFPLAACGHGGHHHDDDGELEVCNDPDSFEDIEDVEVEDLDTGTIFVYDDLFILPGECVFIDEFDEGFYDVRLFWTDATVDEFFDVFIEEDFVTTVEAQN